MRKSQTKLVLLLTTFTALSGFACSDDATPATTDPDAAVSATDSAQSLDAQTADGAATADSEATGDARGAADSQAVSDGTLPIVDSAASDGSFAPSLLIDLPEDQCNTPDGMRKDPKTGNTILSCPNFFGKTADGGAFTAPPALFQITANNRLEPWFAELPVPANAPNRAGPMGIDFGPDGNLYVADHQYRYDTNFKSRILRVNVGNSGKPSSADVVVTGTRLSNAVMWHGDWLYLTDTWAYNDPAPDGGTSPTEGWSAIYRFSKAELAAASTANPIVITAPTIVTSDPHIFAKFVTVKGRGVNLAGADGITFDADGNLYTGKFGDGILSKITFNTDGSLKSQTEFANDPSMTCADGILWDPASKNIYVTDSRKNAVRAVSPTGVVTTIWANDDTDGTGGLLDQPAEPFLRGNELLIANFDAGFTAAQMANNAKSDKPHTISVIKLK